LNTTEHFSKNVCKQTVDGPHLLPYYFSQRGPSTVWLPSFFKKNLILCSAKERVNVNDDRVFISG